MDINGQSKLDDGHKINFVEGLLTPVYLNCYLYGDVTAVKGLCCLLCVILMFDKSWRILLENVLYISRGAICVTGSYPAKQVYLLEPKAWRNLFIGTRD